MKTTFLSVPVIMLFLFLYALPVNAQTVNKIAGDDKTSANINSAPKIDGKIDNSEWNGAKVISDFHMMIPKSESKDYDSTIAYIRQTKDAIYIAIKYWPRGKIIKHGGHARSQQGAFRHPRAVDTPAARRAARRAQSFTALAVSPAMT